MAVAQFDAEKSLLQKVLATQGESTASALKQERDRNAGIVSDRTQEINDAALRKMSDRDKRRMKTDKSFQPQDSDFNAPRSFEFYTNVDYYQTLGVKEYATQDDIKKAYRKLSLAYHPDKTSDADAEQKEEFAAIFIEVKNAYRMLADNPTRRQYDYHRDRNSAKGEISGKKVDDVASFNAHDALRKMEELVAAKARKPSEVKQVVIRCKLEKLVNGGHKAVWYERMIKEKGTMPVEFVPMKRLFRLDVPPRSKPPVVMEFQKAGKQHEGQAPDDLHFLVQAKPHAVLHVIDDNLFVKEPIDVSQVGRDNLIFMAEVETIRGQVVLLLGNNPYSSSCANDSAKSGTLNVSLSGLGLSEASKLCLTLRFGLAPIGSMRPSRKQAEQKTQKMQKDAKADAKRFLIDFGLGPPGGFIESRMTNHIPSFERGLAIQRRRTRTNAAGLTQDVDLDSVGEPVHLYTKPPCSLRLLSNSHMSAGSSSTPKVFAICLSSPSCAKKRCSAAWQKLREHLLPIVWKTSFLMMRGTHDLRPKALVHYAPIYCAFSLQETRDEDFLVPWKLLGDRAFCTGAYWHAAFCYSKHLEHIEDDNKEKAKVFSNRSASYAKVDALQASLADARSAAELAPDWSRAWSRVGWASWKIGELPYLKEALEAFSLAVKLEASRNNVDSLYAVALACGAPDAEWAHTLKEQGTDALRLHEYGQAVAAYTRAMATLPECSIGSEDDHALLRSVIYMNRSIAFTWLRSWSSAVIDGLKAVDTKPDFARARVQLGVVLLASGFHEQAYSEFAMALAFDCGNQLAEKGRKACLLELQLWRSVPSQIRRRTRFSMDRPRPVGSARVFTISDVHYDQKENERWVWAIDDLAYQDDVLIVSGNVADTHSAIVRALTALKSKFRRVFYTPGNHEMRLGNFEVTRFPDSFAKLLAILETCDSLGIDVAPAHVSQGLIIVPLFSWYNSEFDETDPFPSLRAGRVDARCKWPMDADEQLWKYMLKLNEDHLRSCNYGTILTFSHFLPRRGLPFSKDTKAAAKTVGCEELDKQIRQVKSKLHAFGHSCQNYASSHAGIRYVQNSLGPARNRGTDSDNIPSLMLVHNGLNVCIQEWNIRGTFAKHLLYLVAYALPGLDSDQAMDVKKSSRLLHGHNGVKTSFNTLGSRKLDKAGLVQKMWSDLERLSCNTSHVLVVVAESEEALKGLLQSDAQKTWRSSITLFLKDATAFCVPLGLDLAPQEFLSGKPKEDPMLVVCCLKLKSLVTEHSQAYAGMQAAVTAINRLPGVAGKIAASIERVGFGAKTHLELLRALGMQDSSKGFTHCFMVAVDEPESFKLLMQSKTFLRWKAAVEPHFLDDATPQLVLCAPLQISAKSTVPIEMPEDEGQAEREAQ